MGKVYYQRNSEITDCLKNVFRTIIGDELGNIVEIAPGYGYGAYAASLGFSFGHYFMVDIADTRLAILRASGLEEFDRLVFVKQTAAMMSFKDNSIDIVVAVDSLWYDWDFSEYFRCIKEGVRVLKHDGKFILCEQAAHEKIGELQEFLLSNGCYQLKYRKGLNVYRDSKLMLMNKR